MKYPTEKQERYIFDLANTCLNYFFEICLIDDEYRFSAYKKDKYNEISTHEEVSDLINSLNWMCSYMGSYYKSSKNNGVNLQTAKGLERDRECLFEWHSYISKYIHLPDFEDMYFGIKENIEKD